MADKPVPAADYVPVGYWYCSAHSGLVAVGAEVCDLVGLNPDMTCDRHQLMYHNAMPGGVSPHYWRDKYFACQRIAFRLKQRSESYWRDAEVLRDEGDVPMAVAYETISRELHQAAPDGRALCFVLTEDNESFCGRELPCPEHIEGRDVTE